MVNWYTKIVSDISNLPDMISYYEDELLEAKKEVKIQGNLEMNLACLPGQTEYRFAQLQTIEAVLNFLNIELKKLQQKYFKQYFESYNKALTAKEATLYASGEEDVCSFEMFINEVSLIRNRYLAIIKALECKNYQLSSITRLKCAGMQDVNVNDLWIN